MPTTLLLAHSNFQTFLRSCSPSSNWSSSFWHEIYLNMNTRQDCWAHDLLGFCLALAFPMYVRQDIFPIFSCCLYNPHNRPDLPAYPSCLTATHYKDSYSLQELLQSLSMDIYYRTRANITRGLYNLYPIFHCSLYCRAVYDAEWLMLMILFFMQ